MLKLRMGQSIMDTLRDQARSLHGRLNGFDRDKFDDYVTSILKVKGGGLKYGHHHAFDQTNNYPLANVFVAMLQRLVIEADRFGNSTGVLSELLPG